MMKIIHSNNKKLREDNLTKEEIYELKREKLLAVQNKIYLFMEKNGNVFKIPQLTYRRKNC